MKCSSAVHNIKYCNMHETLTSIAGFSATAMSTTFLAKASACATVSLSAEAGQDDTLRVHW